MIISLIILCFNFVFAAEDFGYNYLLGDLNVQSEINYSTLNVNNSQFLRGLTPQEVADLTGVAGTNGQVQFNDAGSFGASSDFIWSNVNSRLGIGTTNPEQEVHLKLDENSFTAFKAENTDTGTSSSVGFNFDAGTHQAFFFVHGANRVLSRYGLTLGGFTELTGASTGGEGIVIGTRNDKPVIIGSNDLEIARFNDDSVGIGTTNPNNKLDVSGSQVIGSSYAGVNTAPTDGLLVEGNVGINTTSPLYSLHVDGDSRITESLIVGDVPNIPLGVGDFSYSSQMFGNGSFSTFALENGAGITVGDYDDQNDIRRSLLGTASYITETMLFCDTTNPFDESFEDRAGLILFSLTTDYANANFFFNDYINSSCMTVNTGTFGNPLGENLTNIVYLSTPPPTFATMAEGYTVFNIKDNSQSGFFINRKNATSHNNFLIDMIAGTDNAVLQHLQMDINGFSNVYMRHDEFYSSVDFNNTETIKNLVTTDLTNMFGGVYYEYEYDLAADNSTEHTLMKVSPEYETIIESGEAIELGKAWYDDTNQIYNVTDNFTDSEELTTVYENDDSILYFGNGDNFTTIQFSLDSLASANLNLVGYYCNTSGEWESLTFVDGTNGLTSQGSITYVNPTNRGVCNKQVNGTLFPDSNNHTYVAFQRTRNFVVNDPVISLVSISNGNEKMFLRKDSIRLIPLTNIPYACTATELGARYFDKDEDTDCICKSVGWRDIEDGSTCT